MTALRRTLLIAVCLGLCAFKFPTQVDHGAPPAPAAPEGLTLVDARPSKNLDSGLESINIFNCAYGAYRAGSDDMTPAPPAIVRDMLAARVNDRLVGHAVELRNFTVHVNSSLPLRNMTRTATGVGGGSVPAHAVIGCAEDDLRGGFVIDEIDVPSPLIVVIDLAVDGVGYHGRCIGPSPGISPPLQRAKPEIHAAWDAAATAGITCVIDKLAGQIRAGTPVAIPAPSRTRAERRARDAAAKHDESEHRADEQ